MGLLAIGPFLHSHTGASRVTGFHMDGVHGVATPSTALGTWAGTSANKAALHSLSASDDESPALGVAASLPTPDHDGFMLAAAVCLLAVVLPLGLLCLSACTWGRAPQRTPMRVYRAGWPPPALAPPL